MAAQAMGINLFKYKELSFVISSFFTGVGGGLLAMFMGSIDSKTFQISLTYDILLIVVLGGIGSVTGSILGAFLITAGREWLRFFDEPLLMVVVLFYRKGIMGTNEFSWDGLFGLLKRSFFPRGKVKHKEGKDE